jgi:acyl-CoA thioesterase-1
LTIDCQNTTSGLAGGTMTGGTARCFGGLGGRGRLEIEILSARRPAQSGAWQAQSHMGYPRHHPPGHNNLAALEPPVPTATATFSGSQTDVQIVALGDASTAGYRLPKSEAWPAKLEALLRQRGISAHVANQGIPGDTSDGMLHRLDDAVPNGMRVVVFTCCGVDNRSPQERVHDHNGNIKAIVARLRTRGIAVVFIGQGLAGKMVRDETGANIAQSAGASWCGWGLEGVAAEDIEYTPTGCHATAKGHDAVAARVLPCVMAGLGQKG